MNLTKFVGKTMNVILEHKRSRTHCDYQTVTTLIVKNITIVNDVLQVAGFDGSTETFTNTKSIDFKNALCVLQYKDGSKTFLEFY